jgi:DNA processing protein
METPLPWLMLKYTPGIGNILLKRLIDRFETPDRVLGAATSELVQVEGISSQLAHHIRHREGARDAQREWALIQAHPFRIVPLTAPDYPPLLRAIPDPPLLLYLLGQLNETERSVSIVGSRAATAYGMAVTRQLSEELSRAGYTIVSGMARGIDTAAHQGALAAGGRTIAVLGSGLLNLYPKENRHLAHHISEMGAVVSEFPLQARPEAHHFPIRNRIISGISRGTLVVEAARKSGSLITARMALEQNREVFAVPGSIRSPKSYGAHFLIKQGAKLVASARDVFEEIEPMSEPPAPREAPGLTTEQVRVLGALGPYPRHIDELARQLLMPAGTLAAQLLQLELAGYARQAPGNYFYSVTR